MPGKLLRAVAAVFGGDAAGKTRFTPSGGDCHHAAGIGAVHQSLGAAQQLDPLDASAAQLLEMRCALGTGRIGHVDAVDKQLGAKTVLTANTQRRGAAGATGIGHRNGRFVAQHVCQVEKAPLQDLLLSDYGN